MKLMKAHSQWNSRPADERFWNLDELLKATLAYRAQSIQRPINLGKLRAEAHDGDVMIIGESGGKASLSNWAFSQLSARAGAPAGYLRELPATLAVQCLNNGLKTRAERIGDEGAAQVLLHCEDDNSYMARAITSDRYTRIWNADVVSRLMDLGSQGWVNPPAYVPWNDKLGEMRTRIATAEDAKLSLTVREGDRIAPAGLYASAEDMFVFLIHPDKIIADGSSEGMMKGIMIWNSEVGKATFGLQTFFFRGVCGNHIIWDAKSVFELNLRHVGKADAKAFSGLEVEVKKYADESVSDIEAQIRLAKSFKLGGATPKEVIDFIFDKGLMTRKDARAAYDAVDIDVDGAPNTAWGFAQGITRLSQKEANADERVALDRAAGRVLNLAF